jgi:dihydrolipoamide dehydrogenase
MKYDLAVVGGGPGGYVAAIRASQHGLKVVLIEQYLSLGGTCTNVGCIPSKALLDSSEHFHNAKKSFKNHGIKVDGLSVDWGKMLARKQKVVQLSSMGIAHLLKSRNIDVIQGKASFLSSNILSVKLDDCETKIEAGKILIATGSKTMDLPFARIDKKRIIGSTEILELSEIPRELIIIGAGVIGLELGSVYARLGTKVRVIEAMDRILPTLDREIAAEAQKVLKRLGFKFYLSHKLTAVKSDDSSAILTVMDPNGKELELQADYCMLAIGRKPYTSGLGLEKAGIACDKSGFIPVDENLETNTPGIYAIGDVIGGMMLAHKAEDEGVFVADQLAGKPPHIDYHLIPGVVYTWPEIANVGKTEDELKSANIEIEVGRFPLVSLGRARAAAEKDGFVKIVADAKSGKLLGVQMIAPRAADMIAQATTAIAKGMTAQELGNLCHAHPTFSEAIKEASLDVNGLAIHK